VGRSKWKNSLATGDASGGWSGAAVARQVTSLLYLNWPSVETERRWRLTSGRSRIQSKKKPKRTERTRRSDGGTGRSKRTLFFSWRKMLARVLRVAEIFTSGQSTQRGRHTLQHIHTHTRARVHTQEEKGGENSLLEYSSLAKQRRGNRNDQLAVKERQHEFLSPRLLLLLSFDWADLTAVRLMFALVTFASIIVHYSPSRGGSGTDGLSSVRDGGRR
jgi:hypothetical protein